ncbi:hypothetical protein [Actinokineospora globicatena]|uniref:hypothetical protein n=1 Tax=Actinokineospora globicatena TaxID=103729 RepID=UPI0020A43E6E|nr:hypothetical protein [Actinokineospora globicatena]MCP2306700.1 hypothetical protein [Actinokineospora globicatena]GLW82184.1 hypothetical protein Aglo01_66650 [Actinokineospora globicatena]GLW88977.1 hypothetical protein Aglo02_66160 [Actinokineospora globicatena]
MRGRDGLLEIASTLIVQGGRGAVGKPPTLVLAGVGGSGRTAVLAEVARKLGDQPHVLVDRAELVRVGQRPTVVDLLATVVLKLVRQDSRRWRFPRFTLGKVISELPLPGDGAEDQVKRGLAGDAAGFAKQIRDSMGRLPDDVTAAVDALVQGLSGRGTRKAASEWYGHRDSGHAGDWAGELVALNQLRRYGGKMGVAEFHRVLVAAFLADTRDAASAKTVDPVVLLDNADNDVAVEFLLALRDARFAAGPRRAADRCVVVAAGGPALPARLDAVETPEAEAAELVRTGGAGPWLAVPLRDLTELEVLALAGDLGVPVVHRHRVVRLVYDVTRGHPGGTHLLTLAANHLDPATACPESMLTAVLPPSVKSVADRVVDQFLDGVPRSIGADLVTLSAARDLTEAGTILGTPAIKTPFVEQEPLGSVAFWAKRDTGKVMHPLLRMLLLRQLAARTAEPTWETVFGLLADDETDNANLYPLFALGDVGLVASQLQALLTRRRGRDWLRLVAALAQCPAPPSVRVEKSYPDEVTAVIATVLTAWRASADPCLVAGRADAHGEVTTGIPALAAAAGTDHGEFVSVAAHHRDQAELWREVTCADPAEEDR